MTETGPPPVVIREARPAVVATRSHGRGGAGNINSKPAENVKATDLATPTIKSQTFTTGRGGAGNMTKKKDDDAARAAQDVETPAHHSKEMKGTFHWGRGGQGNMTTLKGENGTANGNVTANGNGEKTIRKTSAGEAERRGSMKAALGRGKEMLGFGKKEKAMAVDAKNEDAMED
ncbi:unnamed protein product [Zymoseptoria tritici ST99CH_1A5]|uniref:Uncharacterized protein n=2 Tax=Zymoseptoria tritici TaxID=1047171 RepID=A0A2H1GPN3_ZYMTR|nr:unnamed protein product [Zymoseptoria tritici ST99CH_1E4]SMR57833.1 unnamed protein product [Zymoseptoria tritici ST99CH_3D1]SMY26268.1 unnamed protein product [Zymoseptoria tritici ST99CH_1A5]